MSSPAWIYRKLFCRKGHGIHSPFVFEIITQVVEERTPYYAFQDLRAVWLQLQQNNEHIHFRGESIRVNQVLQTACISKKQGEFLFRLANQLKFRSVCVIGSSLGLVPIYLTAYTSGVRCLVMEKEPDCCAAVSTFLSRFANPSTKWIDGIDAAAENGSLSEWEPIDCLYIGKETSMDDLQKGIKRCFPLLKNHSVCILDGIRSTLAKQQYWQTLCKHPSVTVTIDLYDFGLAFLDPKLHQRTYKSILP